MAERKLYTNQNIKSFERRPFVREKHKKDLYYFLWQNSKNKVAIVVEGSIENIYQLLTVTVNCV